MIDSTRTLIAIGSVATVAVVMVASCSRSAGSAHGTSEPAAHATIDGAGATLPFPLYAKWASEFSHVDGSVRVNYQPLGSGAGIRQMSDGVIDFGATDEPMTDEQLKRASDKWQQGGGAGGSGGDLVHVPMTIGAVVVTFNAPGVTTLKLTPDVVADVFRGVVARWDDPRLRDTNPDVQLPAQPITVVHRADGSGTSATFTTYLSRNSPAWQADVGAGTTPRFPVGVGARGNDGITAYVKSTPFAIGYVELAYARQAGLPVALVRNRSGNYVAPTIASLDHAARSFLTVPIREDLRISIVDSSASDAYPIAALSFLILPRDAKHRGKGEALAHFVWWSLHEGQRFAEALDYAPLPSEYVVQAERLVRDLHAEGKPLNVDGLGLGTR